MIMSFTDFIQEYILKILATSNLEIRQTPTSLSLSLSDIGIYSRDGSFSTKIRIVNLNLHSTKGTPWVASIIENYYDIYLCSSSKKLSRFVIKRNGHCLYSEYKIQNLTKNRVFLCLCCLLLL